MLVAPCLLVSDDKSEVELSNMCDVGNVKGKCHLMVIIIDVIKYNLHSK